MKKGRLHINKGFSLVELLVAISIFLVFVVALSGLAVDFKKQVKNSANRERAVSVAEEALEASRNIRDKSFTDLADGTHGLVVSAGEWQYSGLSDSVDIFNRSVVISSIDANTKKIDVTVTWSDQILANNSVTLSSYLTDWRKYIPPAGLTVKKIVINYFSSKTLADFSPYTITGPTGTTSTTTILSLGLATESPANTYTFSTQTLMPGSYTVSEIVDSNYTKTFSGDCNSAGTVVLASNDAKVCTITNEEKYATLMVNKTMINTGGGLKTAADFTPYKVGSTTVIIGTATKFPAGTYTVTETADPDYTVTFGGDCNSSGSVSLAIGNNKICNLTNTYTPSGCTGTPWGDVLNGYSNTAYQSASVTYPSTCVSETRTCTSGILSGSYTNTSCSITYLIPTINTTAVSGITQTTAVSGGNISSDGGASVTARGVVWNTNINPTISLSTKTSDGTGTGSFVSNLSSLSCGTTYYVRAYATNSVGTAYGSNVSFNTSACNALATVTSPTATSITSTGATLGANVTFAGVPNITARGTCYGTSPAPVTNCVAEGGTTTGVFTQARTGLIPGTLYYYRGYAVNSVGTAYSTDGAFTTLGGACSITGIVPTVYDNSASVSAVVNKPVGVVQNDIMFAYVMHNNATDRLNSIPSGWIELGRHKNGSSNQALFYKVAGASEPATYAFGLSANSRFAVTINAYRGCFNTTTPIDTFSNTEYVVNNTTYRAASMTLPSAYTTIIMFPSVNVSGAKTFTAPATQGGGWAEDYANGNASSQFSRNAYSKLMISSGATGVMDAIGFSASNGKHAFAVGLKPL